MTSMRVVDYSDLEILHVVDDNRDEDGWCPLMALVRVLEVTERSVYSRMSWMARYGVVERDGRKPRWAPTQLGGAILLPPGALVNSVVGQPPSELLHLARAVRQVAGTDELTKLLRREWRYQDARGRDA